MKIKHSLWKVTQLVHRLEPSHLPIIFLTKILSAGTPYIYIILGSKILDFIIQGKEIQYTMIYVFMMVGLNGITGMIRWKLEGILGGQRRIIGDRINQMLCQKSLVLDYEILERNETLELVHKAESGMNSHGNISHFCDLLGGFIENVCSIVLSIVVLVGLFIPMKDMVLSPFGTFLNQWYSGLVVIIIMLLTLFGNMRLSRWIQTKEEKNFHDNVDSNRRFMYFFSIIHNYQQGKDIRLYKMQDLILKILRKDQAGFEQRGKVLVKNHNQSAVMVYMLKFIFDVSAYLYVGMKAILGFISIGSVIKYVNAFTQLGNGLSSVLDKFVDIEIRSRYLAYFSDFMAIENLKYEGTLPIEKRDDNEYEIEFRDVSFHYPNTEEVVLSHIDMKLHIGEKMAVVGMNGAGKTTFIKLLCRLYDPTEGEILLNGVNIKYYDYKEYMKLFSVVFQDFQLFAFSLAENVATSLDYEDKKIEEALVKAGFGERLHTMEDGIKTNLYQLQEKGIEISGGEAQKIAIARALYKDAPFVILDEPTSALDPVSEFDIYNRFNDLVKDKTAIYISHRMSSCRFCEKILVFHEGCLVQKGSHGELIEEPGGLYEQLWNAQAQYYA